MAGLGHSRRMLRSWVPRLAFVATGLAGCSLVLDFPKESFGGGGGDAGGGGAGGGSSACFGGGTGPVASEVYWQGIPKIAGSAEVVATTGLAYGDTQKLLVMYGTTSNGLQTFDLPVGTTNQIFAVGRYDNGTTALLTAGFACSTPTFGGPFQAETRRVASDPEELQLFAVGSLPTDDTGNSQWSITSDGSDTCFGADDVEVTAEATAPEENVPFLTSVDTMSALTSPLNESEGVVVDVAASRPLDTVVVTGYAHGVVLGEPQAATVFFLSMVVGFDELTNIVLPTLFVDADDASRAWPGGLALDDTGTAWFGGASCAMAGGCGGPQVFFGRAASGDTEATMLVERPGGVGSAATTVRHRDGRVVVGGHYSGDLTFGAATLPNASAPVPFVAAVDSATDAVLWTWPAADGPTGAAADLYASVVDLAISGTKDCGAVYVLGCVSPASVGFRDCATIEPGKTSFVTKLDLATGAQLWTETVALGDPVTDLMMPTAIVSADDRVWVAATFTGTFEAWGQHLESGTSRESVVLRLEP